MNTTQLNQIEAELSAKLETLKRIKDLHKEANALTQKMLGANGNKPAKQKTPTRRGQIPAKSIRGSIRQIVGCWKGKPFDPKRVTQILAKRRPDVEKPNSNVMEYIRNSRVFAVAPKGKFRYLG